MRIMTPALRFKAVRPLEQLPTRPCWGRVFLTPFAQGASPVALSDKPPSASRAFDIFSSGMLWLGTPAQVVRTPPGSAGNWVPFGFRSRRAGFAGHQCGHDGRLSIRKGAPLAGRPSCLRGNRRQAEARAIASQESTRSWLLAIHCVARFCGVSPPSCATTCNDTSTTFSLTSSSNVAAAG